MRKPFTIAKAKALFAEFLRAGQGRRLAGARAGLAGLAGGWKHSDEFADELGRIQRTPGRRTPWVDR